MGISESNIQNDGTGIMKEGKELIHEINESAPAFGEAAIWWLGQMGFAVKLAGRTFYLDAFLSQHPNRRIPSLLKPEEVTNADYFFGSHDHTDHIDRKVWHQLSVSSPNAKFIVPKLLIPSLSNDLHINLDRFIGLDDGITLELLDNIRITGIASAHEFLDQDPETGSYPYMGCVLEGGGCSLYHSGDTCVYEGMYGKLRKFGKLDVMFLPINGRDGRRYRENIIGNMTFQEAADMAGTFRPGLVVPAHYEMFAKNREDPLLFADYLAAKYPGINHWIGRHGEKFLIKH
ncbi:MBL fold metallo-hydrolase [Lacrimispora celerecrescens]|nr:MBL fold metallo-hydrolase [Lacrimispora celerecrescens]